MTIPSYGSVTHTDATETSGSLTVAVPSGAAANDIMTILMFREITSDTPTATSFLKPSDGSSGFDRIQATDHALYVAWKRLTGADAGNYTVNISGTTAWTELLCIRCTSCITAGNPWDVINSAVDNTASSSASPNVSVTTTQADELLVFGATHFWGGNWTPSGYTERLDGTSLTVGTEPKVTAGASGNKSATCSGGNFRTISWLGALKGTTPPSSVKNSSQFLTFF